MAHIVTYRCDLCDALIENRKAVNAVLIVATVPKIERLRAELCDRCATELAEVSVAFIARRKEALIGR